jgi:WD40 repeat protein
MLRTVATLLCAAAMLFLVDLSVAQDVATKGEAKKQQAPNSPAPSEKTTDAEGEPLPVGVLARLGTTRWRHRSNITGSALSQDGKRLATASSESVAVWDLATGKALFRFPDLTSKERSDAVGSYSGPGTIAFSPDGKWLGSTLLNSPGVWNLENGGAFLRLVAENYGGTCRFTADSKEFIVANSDGTQSWDVSSGKLRTKTPAKDVGAISMDARMYVGKDNIRNLQTGAPIMKPGVNPLEHCTVAFAPNNKLLVLVDNKWERVEIWDIGAAKPRVTFPLPNSATSRYVNTGERFLSYCVQFSPDSKQIIMGTVGRAIHRWDLATRKKLPVLGKLPGEPMSVYALPDGKTLVSTESNGLIRRWDTTTNREIGDPGNYQGATYADLSSDGFLGAINDYRGRVDLWDMRAVKFLRTLRQGESPVTAQAFAPDGKTLAVGLEDGKVVLYDVASGRETRTIRFKKKGLNPTFDSALTNLQFGPDGRSLYVYCVAGELWMRDLVTGKTRWSTEGGGGDWPNGLYTAPSPDGKTLAFVLGGKKLAIFDATTGKQRRVITLDIDERQARPGSVGTIGLAPDGRRFAAHLSEGTIAILDIEKGTEIMRMPDERWFRFLSYSPDGYLLASGSKDVVCIRDALSGREVLRLNGHRENVTAIAFAADGRRLLSCGEDSQVFLWTLRPKSLTSTKRPLESIWLDLCADDAPAAYRAVWELCDDPGSVDFLRAKIVRVPPTDQARLDALVADLDSASFQRRHAAMQDLSLLGDRARVALMAALKKPPSVEAERRMSDLLRVLQKPSPVQMQQIRAVHAMELAATPDSRRLIQHWAQGADGCRLTETSRAALRRLDFRNKEKE